MNSSANSYAMLVVDDDAILARTLSDFLVRQGYVVEVAHSAEEALEAQARSGRICLALVDLMMPGTDGLSLMSQLRERDPELVVVIMTGFGTIESAVESMRRGAEDYITKPFDREAVRKKIGRLMEVFELRERVARLEADLRGSTTAFESLVYVSPQMHRIVEHARSAGATDASVLLVGETGTGKEMLARAIHGAGRRAAAPFIPVNCGALPRELVESELFGHRKGSFTGAVSDMPGVFPSANGGTVFLDEITEMPKDVQVKLLRVLQDKEVRPVGGAKAIGLDIRIIAATNRPLVNVRSEYLRDDLYFRLATVVLELPPLRGRPEDVLVLAQHFAEQMSERYCRPVSLSRSAIELLLRYSFPGNVRELENIIESAAALSHADPQVIQERDLQPLLSRSAPAAKPSEEPLAIDELERVAIERALRRADGNRSRAAALLGISRDTLYRKLREAKADGLREK